MRKKYLLLVTACIFILTTGCSTYLSFDVNWGYNKYLETPKALSVDTKSPDGSIELTLVAPEKCGCYLEKANHKKEIEEKVPYQCIGFTLISDDPGKEIKQKVMDDNVKAYKRYIFYSFGDVARKSMERQLGAYFNQVDVNLASTGYIGSPDAFSTMSYYTKSAVTDDKIMLVRLIALSKDGNIIEAQGKAVNKMGNAHLAWMIPLGIVTFPVGFVIGSVIVDKNYNALMNKTIAEAIDHAAAELSKKLSEEMAQDMHQQYVIYVLLE